METVTNGDSDGVSQNQTREGQGPGTPRKQKKESSTPKPAQDAELKDYVWFYTVEHVQNMNMR